MGQVKYIQIADEIRDRITRGDYSPDQAIPDEMSLAKEFGCSRMTMKKALEVLVFEGLLYRKRGHGTFILQSPLQQDQVNVLSGETIGLTASAKGRQVTSQVIAFHVAFPDPEVAKHLSIDQETPVYHIQRLRFIDGEPYVMERTYMPSPLITGLNEEVLQGSVYQHIQENLGLTISSSHKMIRADKPHELDRKYLDCAPDDPILEVEQVVYLSNGTPFEYSFSRHRYDKFVFTVINIQRSQ